MRPQTEPDPSRRYTRNEPFGICAETFKQRGWRAGDVTAQPPFWAFFAMSISFMAPSSHAAPGV